MGRPIWRRPMHGLQYNPCHTTARCIRETGHGHVWGTGSALLPTSLQAQVDGVEVVRAARSPHRILPWAS